MCVCVWAWMYVILCAVVFFSSQNHLFECTFFLVVFVSLWVYFLSPSLWHSVCVCLLLSQWVVQMYLHLNSKYFSILCVRLFSTIHSIIQKAFLLLLLQSLSLSFGRFNCEFVFFRFFIYICAFFATTLCKYGIGCGILNARSPSFYILLRTYLCVHALIYLARAHPLTCSV